MAVDLTQGALSLSSYYRIGWEILTRYRRHLAVALGLLIIPASVFEQESLLSGVLADGTLLWTLNALLPLIAMALTTATSIYFMVLTARELQLKAVDARVIVHIVIGCFLSVLGGTILWSLVVVIGLMLFIIPGLILGLLLSFFSEFIVLENQSVNASFSRSWSLVRMFFWRVLAIQTVFGLPVFAGILLPVIFESGSGERLFINLLANVYGLCITPPLTIFFLNLRAMQRAGENAVQAVAPQLAD